MLAIDNYSTNNQNSQQRLCSLVCGERCLYAKRYAKALASRRPKGRLASRHEVSLLGQSPQPKPQQLSLFALVSEREDLPPFPLQIEAIPDQDRLNPEWSCRLIHYESNLRLGGQFTYDESKQILETTRYWDFTVNKNRIPKCRNQLLSLLERVCSDRQAAKKQEVAA